VLKIERDQIGAFSRLQRANLVLQTQCARPT
jgi:hypothetical protein